MDLPYSERTNDLQIAGQWELLGIFIMRLLWEIGWIGLNCVFQSVIREIRISLLIKLIQLMCIIRTCKMLSEWEPMFRDSGIPT